MSCFNQTYNHNTRISHRMFLYICLKNVNRVISQDLPSNKSTINLRWGLSMRVNIGNNRNAGNFGGSTYGDLFSVTCFTAPGRGTL